MIKILSNNLTLYFTNTFPYKNKYKKSKKTNTVTIGLGGNIGDVSKRFKQLFLMFQNDSRFFLQKTSPILKNPPFGYLDQDDFLNAIIILKTNLSPIEALNAFQRYEYRFKRRRSFQDAPRTLDIDMIFYNHIKMDTKRLTLPHKSYKNRESVLIPLGFV
ncbi:2-amino-4-hydroxy-6-hydroxymethyldihydropteridine diphosphokinase [Arcobacteraceae bacterium]|nr:2-amino-4-hydroxy-6-hydroxymethyldihydropteridine diphosphokinase [Arcobacteraceae bacterium]